MIAIKGGIIDTISSGTLANGIIVVEGDRIKSVEKKAVVPPSCEVIDASGCYIVPGFIDAHCHVGIEEEIYRVEGDDLNETTDPVTPQLKALDGVNLQDLAFQDAIAGGVTRLLVPPGSANIIGGQAVVLKTWAHTMQDMIVRQAWGLKAALGENPKRVYGSQNKAPKTRMASAALLREALYAASKIADKKKPEPREAFKMDSLVKVIRREMPLLLHVHRADDILTSLRIMDEFNIDMILQHGTEAFMVADELAKRNVAVCLGPLLVNRAKVELKEVSFKNAAILHRAGVDFCLITDHPVVPIQYLGVCAALAVREGLDERTALESVTMAPARILGMGKELGSIEKGKKADIVVYDGHPLEVKSKVKYAMIDGAIWGG
ncbi:MAG: amidohydrolase [Acidobacteriota bacterium]